MSHSHRDDIVTRANLAIYMATQVITRLGFFIGLNKSVLTPTAEITFLGMIIDTNKRAFILPHYKKKKFAKLLEALLLSQVVNITSFQKFVGKCFSFGLAIPYTGHKIVHFML